MKKTLALLFTVALAFFTAGCARHIIVEEALQLSATDQLRTAYNLWYDEENVIHSINVQKGSILPFGTEIEILEATEDEITIRTMDTRKTYTIIYEPNYRLVTPEEYMRSVFTTLPDDTLTEGMALSTIEKIRKGIVERGMTKDEVLRAYGPPCRFKTPSDSLDTWLYWTDYLVGRRVIFNNNIVVEILEL